jgi:myo-inositol-1(or 4)-monophosphatase
MTHHVEGRTPVTPDVIAPPLARKIAGTVRQVMAEIRPELVHAALTGDRGESESTDGDWIG